LGVFDDTSFVVVWTSQNQDKSDNGIFAQYFEASAAKFGPELQVNAEFRNTSDFSLNFKHKLGSKMRRW